MCSHFVLFFFIEGIILPKWSWSHITPHKANWWPISSMVDLMTMMVKKMKERDKALIMVEMMMHLDHPDHQHVARERLQNNRPRRLWDNKQVIKPGEEGVNQKRRHLRPSSPSSSSSSKSLSSSSWRYWNIEIIKRRQNQLFSTSPRSPWKPLMVVLNCWFSILQVGDYEQTEVLVKMAQ